MQRAGFAMRRWRARRVEFEGWDHGGKTARPPVTFEPGDPAFTITARLFRVRAVVWPDVPKWVWGEDPSGRVLFWERIPESDRASIAQVRPQRVIRDDGFRHGYEPIPEGEPIEGQELEVWQD